MTEAVTPTSGGSSTTAGPESNPQHTAKAHSSNSFSSLADLKRKAPKLYKVMMEGVAMQIVDSMKRQQDHIKEVMREGRKAAGIS